MTAWTLATEPSPWRFPSEIMVAITAPCLIASTLSFMALIAVPVAPEVDEALQRATAAMQGQDYTGAVRALEPAMTRLADQPLAWRALGAAYLKLRRSADAESAYQKDLELEPQSAAALFNLGMATAQAGKKEVALSWFARAAATHRIDMTELEVEPDVAAWRDDPKFRAILPNSDDFAHPFVESVRVLHEWDGEAAGDQFGWVARALGDVNGDGIQDFVTSAPTKDIHGENAGRIYVFSSEGKLLWSKDGSPGDQLGTGVEAAGDTDRDGVPDVIAGAPGIDTAYVYSGRDGRTLLTLHGERKGDNFGDHVASVGDIDGDGYADVIVGAAGNNAGGAGAGRAYVYSGKDGKLLLTLTGERAGDAFGSTVSGFTGKGRRFIVVGAPTAGEHHTGRVYVYKSLSAKPAFTIDADPSGAALGYMFVSVLGDVDGDGEPDIFASDFSDGSRGPKTGKVYVYSGRTGKLLYRWVGDTAGEGFGTTQSVAGDVNGDGHADVIVGSWQYSQTAQSAGRAYLYDGRTGRLLRTYTCKIPGDTFGFDAVGLKIHTADREPALLITSAWSGIHGHHSGRIFLIAAGIDR